MRYAVWAMTREQLQASASEAITNTGLTAFCDKTGVAKTTWTRLLSGLPMREGTLLMLEQRILTLHRANGAVPSSAESKA